MNKLLAIFSLLGAVVCVALERQPGPASMLAHGLRARGVLVDSEVAFVMMLLAGAGLMVRNFGRLNGVHPGFDPEHLVAVDLHLVRPNYTNSLGETRFLERLFPSVATLPRAQSAAITTGAVELDCARCRRQLDFAGSRLNRE